MNEKDLKKLNNNLETLTKAVKNMGVLMNDAILALRKASMLFEENLKSQEKTDILADGQMVGTVGVDMGDPDGDILVESESHVDPFKMVTITVYRRQGKIIEVTEFDNRSGVSRVITEEWLQDHPQEG